MSRIQINRDEVVCPFDPEARFRDLRLLYWMPTPHTIAGRLLFVALTPLYLVVSVLLAFVQMLLDLSLSTVSWFRVVSGV